MNPLTLAKDVPSAAIGSALAFTMTLRFRRATRKDTEFHLVLQTLMCMQWNAASQTRKQTHRQEMCHKTHLC
jgi:hypothetical protein